jgi:glycosidase
MQNNLNLNWKSNLQGVTDYEWFGNVLRTLRNNSGEELYNTLVQDILYKDPMRNEIFLDNHDQDRFYSVVGEDFDKFKMGIGLLLTQRGIPQIYYGTEILMKNFKKPSDAEVRKDFPGGWKEDSLSKFSASGRTERENEAYDYVKKLAHFRLQASALKTGKMMQFLPANGLYVYFRYDKHETVMCIMNPGDKERPIDFDKYAERTKGFNTIRNIIDDSTHTLSEKIVIPPKHLWILELK